MQLIGIRLASNLCKHYIATNALQQGAPADMLLPVCHGPELIEFHKQAIVGAGFPAEKLAGVSIPLSMPVALATDQNPFALCFVMEHTRLLLAQLLQGQVPSEGDMSKAAALAYQNLTAIAILMQGNPTMTATLPADIAATIPLNTVLTQTAK